MSKNNPDDDGFKLVTYKKPRNVSVTPEQLKLYESYDADVDSTIRRIKTAKEDLLTTDLYSSVLASLREALNILHFPEIKEIVCFGLGKVGDSIIARYQIALLLCLRDLYNVETFVYDPIFNQNDINVLSAFNLTLLKSNLEAKYKIKEKSTTIFYLPHCSKQLYNNLLWANWGLQLNSCIIIGNSFTKILEIHTKKHITENAEYILNASTFLTELAIFNSFKYYEVFNCTAIHIFPWENLCLISQDFWKYSTEPKYTGSIGFIKNKPNKEADL